MLRILGNVLCVVIGLGGILAIAYIIVAGYTKGIEFETVCTLALPTWLLVEGMDGLRNALRR